jgi:RHS repeat-associated protein
MEVNFAGGSSVVTYTYDRADRCVVVYDVGAGLVTTDTYDAAGRHSARTAGNGAESSFAYDAAGRMTGIAHLKTAPSTYNQRFTYTYDKVANRLTLLELDGSRTTWTYDKTYRLTQENRSGTSPHNTVHSYDPVGNRVSEDTDGTEINFDYTAANQVSQSTAPADPDPIVTGYGYDGAGNQTEVTEGGSGGPHLVDHTNTWDGDNRLTRVWPSPAGMGALPTTMTYNADGLRVRVAGPSGTLDKVWDLALGAGAPLIAETNGQTVVRRYAHKPVLYGDVLHQTGSGATRFYLFDALGSTTGLTDTNKNFTDTYLYKAYGATTQSGGTTNPFAWVGRYGYQWDNQFDGGYFSNHYIRERHYWAAIAAWLSADPLGLVAGQNEYLYSRPNPVGAIDASGMVSFPPQLLPLLPLIFCLFGAGTASEAEVILQLIEDFRLGRPISIDLGAVGCAAATGCFAGECVLIFALGPNPVTGSVAALCLAIAQWLCQNCGPTFGCRTPKICGG